MYRGGRGEENVDRLNDTQTHPVGVDSIRPLSSNGFEPTIPVKNIQSLLSYNTENCYPDSNIDIVLEEEESRKRREKKRKI